MEGRSEDDIAFLLPKKALGLEGRRAARELVLALGLAVAAGGPVGWNVLAAGFGLNSIALTLKAAEVGVRTALEVRELGTALGSTVGLLGGF